MSMTRTAGRPAVAGDPRVLVAQRGLPVGSRVERDRPARSEDAPSGRGRRRAGDGLAAGPSRKASMRSLVRSSWWSAGSAKRARRRPALARVGSWAARVGREVSRSVVGGRWSEPERRAGGVGGRRLSRGRRARAASLARPGGSGRGEDQRDLDERAVGDHQVDVLAAPGVGHDPVEDRRGARPRRSMIRAVAGTSARTGPLRWMVRRGSAVEVADPGPRCGSSACR